MAMAERAELVARLSLKDDFSGTLKRIEGNTKKSASIMRGALSSGIGRSVSRIAERGVRALFGQVTGGLDSLAELESATTSVDGAIKQMGLTGQVTSGQIAGWANEIEANTEAAFDDKEITQAATTLIRFGKVTTSNLKPALTVIADLATKTGSVESAATLLAKALADPEKAAGKLARQGIILTKSQEKQIKAMMEAGDVAGAQKVILDAVTVATEGAAKAMNGPFVDSQKVLADVVEDAQRALAIGFLPVLMEVRDILSKELAKKSTLDNIKKFGEGLAGGLRGLIQTARGLPWDLIGNSLKTAAAGGKALLDAFLGLPPWVQAAVASGWGLNKLTGGLVMKIGVELVSGTVEGVFKQFFARGATPANPMYVSDVLGGKNPLKNTPPSVVPAGATAAGGGVLAGLLSSAGILGGFIAIGESLASLPGAFTNFQAAMDGITNKDLPAARSAFDDFVEGMPKFNPLVPTAVLDMIQRELDKVPPRRVIPDDGSMTDPGQRLGLTREDLNDAFNRGAVATTLGQSKDTFTAIRDNIETSRIGVTTELGLTRNGIITALATPPPMSPDERDELRQLGTKTEQSRDATEASRIALSTKLGETRGAVDTQGQVQTAATGRARDAIEASRIATVTALGTTGDRVTAARDAIETSRIALTTKLGDVRTGVDNNKTATDRARDAVEASRIALSSKLDTAKASIDLGKTATDRARDAIETARIAQVSAVTTSATTISNRGSADAQAIVTAIRNKDFSVKVTVNSSGSPDDRDKPKVTVQTGGNVNRATANQSGGPDDRG